MPAVKNIIPVFCVLTAWLMCEAAEETGAGLVATATWLPPPFKGFAGC